MFVWWRSKEKVEQENKGFETDKSWGGRGWRGRSSKADWLDAVTSYTITALMSIYL